MKSIFLYRDDGVCPSSLRATVRSLRTVTNRPITLVKRGNFNAIVHDAAGEDRGEAGQARPEFLDVRGIHEVIHAAEAAAAAAGSAHAPAAAITPGEAVGIDGPLGGGG